MQAVLLVMNTVIKSPVETTQKSKCENNICSVISALFSSVAVPFNSLIKALQLAVDLTKIEL